MVLEISLQEAFEKKPLILRHVGAKHHENRLSHKKNVFRLFSDLTKASVPKWKGDGS